MLSKVKTMYYTYTQAKYSRKETEMQENERMKEMFAGACMFPCRLLAEIIEMEHRANGEDYEELVDTAAKQLTEAIEMQKVMPDTIMAGEALKMELISTLYSKNLDDIEDILMFGVEAEMANKKEGDPDVM